MNRSKTNLLAQFVRQQRKFHKMTQQDLADRAGVGIRFVRELEGGKPTLRMDKVNIVLDLFGHALGPVVCSSEK
jgi:y4mF family transcriptional regulator